MGDFRRMTLFCLEKRLSKHKMTINSINVPTTGYAYGGRQTVDFVPRVAKSKQTF